LTKICTGMLVGWRKRGELDAKRAGTKPNHSVFEKGVGGDGGRKKEKSSVDS